MSRFFSTDLKDLNPYIPGEQPVSGGFVKLNTNESPFPPSPEVIKALDESRVSELRLYSDPTAKTLTDAIARYYGVPSDSIVTSNGSDEILAFIIKAFCKDRGLAFADVTYGFYEVFSKLFGVEFVTVPLDRDFKIDVNDYKGLSQNIIIANPNAQTGVYIPVSDIKTLVSENKERLVIIDEAYVDFGGESVIPLTREYDNLVVVQTFSKSRSLAGARIGFMVADAALAADVKKIKYSFNPYNLNRLSILAGAAALADKEYFVKTTAEIIKNREFLTYSLKLMGFKVIDSKANFVLASHGAECGRDLYLALKKEGVLVRHFPGGRIDDFIRIMVGSAEELAVLIQKLGIILQGAENA